MIHDIALDRHRIQPVSTLQNGAYGLFDVAISVPTVVGRKAPVSLYSMQHVTFEEDQGAYNQRDAEGFIKLNALRLRLRALGQGGPRS